MSFLKSIPSTWERWIFKILEKGHFSFASQFVSSISSRPCYRHQNTLFKTPDIASLCFVLFSPFFSSFGAQLVKSISILLKNIVYALAKNVKKTMMNKHKRLFIVKNESFFDPELCCILESLLSSCLAAIHIHRKQTSWKIKIFALCNCIYSFRREKITTKSCFESFSVFTRKFPIFCFVTNKAVIIYDEKFNLLAQRKVFELQLGRKLRK